MPPADKAAGLNALGVADLHAAYRAGVADPVSVWQRCSERLDRIAPGLGCVLTRTDELARRQAQDSAARWRAGRPLGALDGVPLALKDNIDVAGWPCSAGTAAWRERLAPADAQAWSRLAAAGAVLAGKLAMDEGALGAVTRNPTFGDCRNPLDTRRTPGGSSGGSAAAVAAGLCAAALGTDTLGSVRIPAAYCGLFGFKPSAGSVPMQGIAPLCEAFDTVGPLARSGTDLAWVARVLMGCALPNSSPNAPPNSPPTSPLDAAAGAGAPVAPVASFASGAPWAGLRIGVPDIGAGMALQPAIARALAELRSRLTAAGAQLIDLEVPEWEPAAARRAALLLCEREGHAFWSQALGPDLPGLSAAFAAMLRYPLSLPEEKLVRAREQVERVRQHAAQVFDAVDLLLMPTTPQVAFASADAAPADQADLAALANLMGAPALAFPWSGDPLPLSFQWLAAPGRDERLLGLAPQLDRWAEVRAVRGRLPLG